MDQANVEFIPITILIHYLGIYTKKERNKAVFGTLPLLPSFIIQTAIVTCLYTEALLVLFSPTAATPKITNFTLYILASSKRDFSEVIKGQLTIQKH